MQELTSVFMHVFRDVALTVQQGRIESPVPIEYLLENIGGIEKASSKLLSLKILSAHELISLYTLNNKPHTSFASITNKGDALCQNLPIKVQHNTNSEKLNELLEVVENVLLAILHKGYVVGSGDFTIETLRGFDEGLLEEVSDSFLTKCCNFLVKFQVFSTYEHNGTEYYQSQIDLEDWLNFTAPERNSDLLTPSSARLPMEGFVLAPPNRIALEQINGNLEKIISELRASNQARYHIGEALDEITSRLEAAKLYINTPGPKSRRTLQVIAISALTFISLKFADTALGTLAEQTIDLILAYLGFL